MCTYIECTHKRCTWQEPICYKWIMKNPKNLQLVRLGEQIRKVRSEHGYSQEDFAAKAGINRSYYGGVERGERNICALMLMQIASALEVEVGELFPLMREQ